jgi:hypothetical protein
MEQETYHLYTALHKAYDYTTTIQSLKAYNNNNL